MKTIGICPSISKSLAPKFINPIFELFQKHGFQTFIDDSYQGLTNIPRMDLLTPVDIYITLGGDGTLLAFKQKYKNNHKKNPKNRIYKKIHLFVLHLIKIKQNNAKKHFRWKKFNIGLWLKDEWGNGVFGL